jgi:hypothetical protein
LASFKADIGAITNNEDSEMFEDYDNDNSDESFICKDLKILK